MVLAACVEADAILVTSDRDFNQLVRRHTPRPAFVFCRIATLPPQEQSRVLLLALAQMTPEPGSIMVISPTRVRKSHW